MGSRYRFISFLIFKVVVAGEQSDFTIIQLARQEKLADHTRTIIILSCDIDFICLAPPNSIDALLDPTRRTIIWKKDVLELLEMNEGDIFDAFCIGGCDDIQHNLKGVGWHRATQFVKADHVSEQSLISEFDKIDEQIF